MAKDFKTTILISGNSKDAVSAIRGVTREFDKLEAKAVSSNSRTAAAADAASRATKTAGVALATAAAAAGGALVALTKSGLATVDALGKSADKLGITTQAYASLSHAANLAGVQQASLESAFKRMARTVSDASEGLSASERSLTALGLSSEALLKLSPDKQFAAIADALNGVENATRRAALAQQVFGRSGVDLLNLTKEGSAGFAAFAHEAQVLGLNISRIDAAKVEAANDAVGRIRTGFSGLGQQLAVQFAPLIEDIAVQFFDATEAAGGMEEVARQAFDGMTNAAGLFLDVLDGLEVAWLRVKVATGEAMAIGLEAARASNPVGLVTRLIKGPMEYSQALENNAREARAQIDALLAREPASVRFLNKLREISRAGGAAPRKSAASSPSVEDLKASSAAADRAKSIASLIAGLEKEAATHGKTAAELAQYELAQLGASKADRARAAALSETIAQLLASEKAETERKNRIAKIPSQLEEVQAEILRLTGGEADSQASAMSTRYAQLIEDLKAQSDTAGIALVERLINLSAVDASLAKIKSRITEAADAFSQAQQNAANQVATGGLSPAAARSDVTAAGTAGLAALQAAKNDLLAEDQGLPAVAAALAEIDAQMARIAGESATGLTRALIDLRKEAAGLADSFAGDSAAAFKDNLASLFSSLLDGSKGAKDAIKDFARGFADAMAQVAANALATMVTLKLLNAAMGAAGGGGAGGALASVLHTGGGAGGALASVLHTGGFAGEGGGKRRVPGYIFAGAARFHDDSIVPGLKPGEVPAILQAGERVLTADQQASAAQGGGAQNIRINLLDNRANVGDYMTSSDGERVLLEVIERNALSVRRLIGGS